MTTAVMGVTSVGSSAPALAVSPFTIHTSNGFVTKIGAFKTTGTISQARAIFGQPSSAQPNDDGCRVRWRGIKLDASFVSFGLHGSCDDSLRLQSATIKGTRFRTTGGVRVGSRSSTIPFKHRLASFEDGAWVIARADFGYGESTEIPTVRALVGGGRVRALKLYVGAAGD